MAATSRRAGSRSSPHKSAAEGQAVQIALCGAHSGGIFVIGATFSGSEGRQIGTRGASASALFGGAGVFHRLRPAGDIRDAMTAAARSKAFDRTTLAFVAVLFAATALRIWAL